MFNENECPYPGLRTFQEHESAYFFGRDSQIKEIVTRLRNNRFVAVIGGSGSGKSSLVLAGAIPELRTLAIQEAGDFWVPVITTPGTNHAGNNNPIRRLAEAFCSVLKENKRDIKRCAEFLREKNGFSKLIEEYGRELQDSDGVDLTLTKLPTTTNDPLEHDDLLETTRSKPDYLVKVNFLFLIDQFEELFHPSNEAVKSDCEHLVRLITEHFEQSQDLSNRKKSSQICVALTMRSEHLNDCPRYQKLPDAINAASFLVKRLNEKEIEKAIREPAQAFLRRAFREAEIIARREDASLPDEDNWPEKISFDQSVIDRLLSDTRKIVTQQDHADLLPLLQHLLYWIWDCALTRTKFTSDAITIALTFPYEIKWEDFCLAVYPEGKEIDENTNTLTQCLEQRCEWIYNQEANKPWRLLWENIFRNLAFKDPNTGTYTQRRASIIEFDKFPSNAELNEKLLNVDTKNIQDKLKRILEAWLGPHQYLILNEDEHTIKVSHESLIRRWKRFRDWIDWKDRQFQEYAQLLDDCVKWIDNNKKSQYLIAGVALRRVKEYNLLEALKSSSLQTQFRNLLNLHRDKQSLSKAQNSIHDFLNKSFDKKRRLRVILPIFGFIAGLSLTLLLLYEGKYLAEKKETLLQSLGLAEETQLALPPNNIPKNTQELQFPLTNILASIRIAQQGQENIDNFWLPERFHKEDIKDINKYSNLANFRTLSALRYILLGSAWNLSKNNDDINQVKTVTEEECKHTEIDEKEIEKDAVKVSFFTPPESNTNTYGLLTFPDKEGQIQVYWATRDKEEKCISNSKQKVWWADKGNKLGIDAYLNYLVEIGPNTTQIIGLGWPIVTLLEKDHPLDTSHRIRFNNVINSQNSPEKENIINVIKLKTIKQNLAEDIKIGENWFRLFNRFPVDVEIPNNELISFTQYYESERCIENPHITKSKMMQSEERAYCLQVIEEKYEYKGIERNTYYGSLYKIDRGNQENHLPIINNLAFGEKLPDAIKLDEQNGFIYSRSNNSWYKQPWNHRSWIKRAFEVYDFGKKTEETKVATEYLKFIELFSLSESKVSGYVHHLREQDKYYSLKLEIQKNSLSTAETR